MRKYLSMTCLAGLLFVSCSKSGINNTGVNGVPRMDSINTSNLLSPSPYQYTYDEPATGWHGMAYFTYDNSGRVTKRVTDYRPNPPYDTVIYQSAEDVILIFIVNASSYSAQYKKREILFHGGLVKWKIYSTPTGSGTIRMDTVEYIHNAQGQLAMTKGHFELFTLESNFYYSKAGNLDSVITLNRDNKTGQPQGLGWEERFGYDGKANPLKGNCLWDDLLYRSLSNNNMTSYLYRYGGGGWGNWSWSLHYKANGEVDLGN